MITIAIAVLLALWLARELADWGLPIFGLFGYWAFVVGLGGATGMVVIVVGGLIKKLGSPR